MKKKNYEKKINKKQSKTFHIIILLTDIVSARNFEFSY